MRRVIRRLLIAASASALVIILAALLLYQASRCVPSFYQQALAAPASTQAEDGERFERAALDLHNRLQHAGHWEARLTQDEINGWLATDLPEKFADALPAGVSQPRIAIDRGMVRIAVRYQRGGLDTVLSAAGESYLTAQPNEIAVRLDQARAGLVPVPLARFLDEIAQQAARANLPLRWTEARGAPVALIRLPLDAGAANRRRLVLDSMQWDQGQLVLGGHTEEESAAGEATHPATAIQPSDKDTRQR